MTPPELVVDETFDCFRITCLKLMTYDEFEFRKSVDLALRVAETRRQIAWPEAAVPPRIKARFESARLLITAGFFLLVSRLEGCCMSRLSLLSLAVMSL